MKLIPYFLLYFYLITLSGFFVITFKRKFEHCLPVALFTVMMLMYVTGFLQNIYLGFYLSLILCFIFIITSIIQIIKNRQYIHFLLDHFKTTGLLFFSILFVYLAILHAHTSYSYWDEFMHWGFMSKESFRLNQFYSEPNSLLIIHKDYPPITTILNLIVLKIISPEFKERATYLALSFCIFILFLDTLPTVQKRSEKMIKGFCLIAFLLAQVIVFHHYFPNFTDSIYTDTLLGILCAYGLYVVIFFDDSAFDHIKLTLTLCVLLLCKQMGLAFFLLILFLFTLKHYKHLKWSHLCFVILPFIAYQSWNIYIDVLQLKGQFSLQQIQIKNLFTQQLLPTQKEAFHNFIHALWYKPLLKLPISINYCIASLFVGLSLASFKKQKLVGVTYILGAIGYALGMWLLYIFSFNDYEGPTLASYERYMGTYIYMGITLFIFLLTKLQVKWQRVALTLVVLISMTQSNILKLTYSNGSTPYYKSERYKILLETFKSLPIADKKMLVISQFHNDNIVVLPYAFPETKFYHISLGTPKYEGDINSVNLTTDEFLMLVLQHDYVYIDNYDDIFYNDYWIKITDEIPYNKALYEVHPSMRLIYVGGN